MVAIVILFCCKVGPRMPDKRPRLVYEACNRALIHRKSQIMNKKIGGLKPQLNANRVRNKSKMMMMVKKIKKTSNFFNFPMSRIRRIIKSKSFDFLIAEDAVFLVKKATDKFLEQFCEDEYACCSKDRKKSLAYKHLDFVHEKIKAEYALAERKLVEAGEG